MFPGVNPAQMKSMMKQMGIKQEDVLAERVIIETSDSKIVIEPASVQKITMQGATSWQVAGEAREEAREQGISDADIEMVMEKTGVDRTDALKALEDSGGDIAQAIIRLNK